MRKIKMKTTWQRFEALMLSALLLIMMMPISMFPVHAEADENEEWVTVKVQDEEGNAVSGAAITYTIEKDSSAADETEAATGGAITEGNETETATGGAIADSNETETATGGAIADSNEFETVTGSAITDSVGVAKVLSSSKYVSGLIITATISKDGYETNDNTLKSAKITSATHEFSVTLKELPDIEGITVDPLVADYMVNMPQELVQVSAPTGAAIEYSTDNSSWSSDVPKEENAGEYSVWVRISMEGYKTHKEELKAVINPININDINITTKAGITYKEDEDQELVELTGSFQENDVVTWKVKRLGDKEFTEEKSKDIPTRKAADKYQVQLVVERANYNKFESEVVTAEISKAQLDFSITTKAGITYKEDEDQELVELTDSFQENDVVTWKVKRPGDKEFTEEKSKDIPTGNAAGEYQVQLVVERANYNTFESEVVTAEISKAQLDLTGLEVVALDGVYTGSPQPAATVRNKGDYTLKYQLDDGDETIDIDNEAWDDQIPTVTDAGSYILWVKAVKDNYEDSDVEVTKAEHAVIPYNVYVEKADQRFAFKYYNSEESEESSVEMTAGEMEDNKKDFDFVAEDSEQKVGEAISYSVELAEEDVGIASINQEGELTVKGAGKIIVKATLPGNDNYKECEITHTLFVSGKVTSGGEWVSFSDAEVKYTLGNEDGIQSKVATIKDLRDKGTISYSIENADDIGLSINGSDGTITVSDYGKLVRAIELNGGESLDVTVKATKAEYTGDSWGSAKWSAKYPEDSATYVLKVKLADIPDNPYKLYDEDGKELQIDDDDDDVWYTSTVVVEPAEDYEIIRDDDLSGSNPSFEKSVKIGEKADDQGANKEHAVYLKNSNGEITKKVVTSVCKLDNRGPRDLAIIFPKKEAVEKVMYYDDKITVEFVAYDDASGVRQFGWEYKKEDGASASILDDDSGTVAARLDTSDPSNKKYVGTLTLPRNQAEQLRGNLEIWATDAVEHKSSRYKDGVFVVDTDPPKQNVKYGLKNGEGSTQTIGSKQYFSNDVEFTFDIVEANFFKDDVKITVSKNGAAPQIQDLSWANTNNTDEHEAKLTLSDDADYVVSMTYKDRSGNEMASYTSGTITVDKTAPIIEFEYKDYTDSTAPQAAAVKITEHNFRASDIELETLAKNIAGDIVESNNLQQYLRTCEWTSVGDVHTAVISDEFVDAIYSLTFNYKDLSLNAAAEVKPVSFIVDRSAPKTAEMSISYSNPIIETILSAISLGFYNPDVTVTFTAYDSISGVDYFTWSYMKESGASDSNAAGYADSVLPAIQDSTDKTKYTASVTLPRNVAEQIRGSVAFSATDKFNNTSDKLTDNNHVLIVDTVAPTMNVEYSAADNSFNGKDYYNKSLTVTFTVTEANFIKEDVKVKLKKNDDSAVEITPDWIDSSTDVHIGTYTIEASANHANDGDYVFTVDYKDHSSNEMASYTSNTKVIDTCIPEIRVEYSNVNPVNIFTDSDGNQRRYFASTNTATITIAEHNFNAADAEYTIVAKDVAGNQLNADSLYTASSWTTSGDNNIITITYPGDANYTFDIEYTDLAMLQADDYNPDYFTVDTTHPADLQVSYSTDLLDTVLSTITFGFYNAKATVTITATDNISSIYSMKYSYINADGVSNVNAQLVDVVIDESQITRSNGDAVGTASFEIPNSVLAANNQFNGTVSFTATDRANNESDYLRDTKRIVIDNISPTANVEYNAPIQQLNGISYYDGDVNASVTINEANFYEEDVHITVTKDGTATPVTASWSTGNTDVHTGTFTISGDGNYFVNITYSDKSNNAMQEYSSEQMIIDTEIAEATITINGQDADGKAFKDEVVPAISFEDKNFESYEVKLYRTSFAEKNVDVTEKFISGHITTNETGGNGSFDTFERIAENDGIYTMTVETKDKAGHTIEKSVTFTVNRYGSVYEYNDYLISLIKDGGAYVQSVDEDFEITEYNADRLLSGSLDIEISRDGKPLDDSQFTVSPEINETVATGSSGWYQYSYTIAKENFATDGIYKIAVSSKDAAGNSPENNNYEDMGILFRVDSTAPEITSISGLEGSVINATEQTVKYTVFDTIGLASVSVYVGGNEIASITDFTEDVNNYSGAFVIKENSSAQTVRLVVTDLAGNTTDTDADDFSSAYAFSNAVTVSTNFFVRWFANKPLFFGTVGGSVAVVGGSAGATVFFRKRKLPKI